jgi:hypothetical protein
MSIIRNILNSTKLLVNNSLPTTGSNTFIGTQTHSGSVIPAIDNTYDLGSTTYQWRDIYVSSGSLYIDGTKVLSSTNQELQITTDNGQSIKILEAGSDNIILQSADGNIELKTSGGGDVILDPTSGVIGVKGTMTIYSGNKILSSDGNTIQFGNDLGITGSLTTTSGNINGINLSTFSSSISTQFSTIQTNSGSSNNRLTNLENKTGSFATTGSNTFFGTQTFSGSLYVANDLIVQGSSSIQYISASSVSIGTNIIQLNTANPSVRYAGLSIIDSGSVGGSGSFLYDSVQDEFIFVHRGNGTNITSSHFILGPETYDNLGNETYLTNNRLPKGTGIEHLVDSNITDSGTLITLGSNTTITGTLVATGTTLVSGSSQVIGILSSLNTYTGSNDTTNTTQTSRLDQLSTATGSAITRLSTLEVETSNLETFTSSINTTIKTRLNTETVVSGSSQVTLSATTGYGTVINQALLTTSSPTFASVIGTITSSGNGDSNAPFRFSADYSGWMSHVAGTPGNNDGWGIFWAGNSGARYGTNGTGGPGDIWSNSTNPNEYVFVGQGQTYMSIHGNSGNVWMGGQLRVKGDVLPNTNNTHNLGSTSLRWANVYTNDLHLSNEDKVGGNDIDGTTGNWTIQEGEEHLYIINNKTGKKFKFSLEEIQ